MSETPRLQLPLIEAAQAQKHVTVNEALIRLDALIGASVAGFGTLTPPPAPAEGALYALGPVPGGDWAGQGGRLALAANGGWLFLDPKAGFRIRMATGAAYTHDGTGWVPANLAVSPGGAGLAASVLEYDHDLTAVGLSDIAAAIPAHGLVIGVTARVLAEIEGPATWRLGVPGSDNRYGSGLGTATGSYALGLTGQPQAYYADTAIRLTAEGADFSAGRVRVAVHCLGLTPPRAV